MIDQVSHAASGPNADDGASSPCESDVEADSPHSAIRLFGVDFTSAPRRAKPIQVAHGLIRGSTLRVCRVESLVEWSAFEAFLSRPGPWVGAFDFPFGLPRPLIQRLGWPDDWRQLVALVATLGRRDFAQILDEARQARPVGDRYLYRAGDRAAGAASPMKLVNPPVGLMFFEGAARLARAGLCILPCAPSKDSRIAVEGYPGMIARALGIRSYKRDGPEGRTTARRAERGRLLERLPHWIASGSGLRLDLPDYVVEACIDDGCGDAADAVVLLAQAAQAARALGRNEPLAGIPAEVDPLEGWIIGTPWVNTKACSVRDEAQGVRGAATEDISSWQAR